MEDQGNNQATGGASIRRPVERVAAEQWTLQEAAEELSARSNGLRDMREWAAWLESRTEANVFSTIGGVVKADDVNSALDADPDRYWRSCHPRLPSTKLADDGTIGWFDGSLHADHWFQMTTVSPREAASLLCCIDPLDDTSEPERITTDKTNPDDFKLLRRVFSDAEVSDGSGRPLVDWIEVAKWRRCKFHSWAEQYLAARQRLGLPVARSSSDVMSRQNVPQAVAHADTNQEIARSTASPPPKSEPAPVVAGASDDVEPAQAAPVVPRNPQEIPGVTESAFDVVIPPWTVKKPTRFHRYMRPLYELVQRWHDSGKGAPPTSFDVLGEWREKRPAEIEKFNDFDFDCDGKTVNKRALREAIRRIAITPKTTR